MKILTSIAILLLITGCSIFQTNPYLWPVGKEEKILLFINKEIDDFVESCEEEYKDNQGFIDFKKNIKNHKPVELRISPNGLKIQLTFANNRIQVLEQNEWDHTFYSGIGFGYEVSEGQSAGVQKVINIKKEDF